jgi:hypothetical protein
MTARFYDAFGGFFERVIPAKEGPHKLRMTLSQPVAPLVRFLTTFGMTGALLINAEWSLLTNLPQAARRCATEPPLYPRLQDVRYDFSQLPMSSSVPGFRSGPGENKSNPLGLFFPG